MPARDSVADDLLGQARAAVERGDAVAATDLVARAFAADPSDPHVRDLYVGLHLARAIRLAATAREARRADIAKRAIPYDTEFRDSPNVEAAFEEALRAHDDLLGADPGNEKVLVMKAALLFRRDREKGRAEALEILRRIQEVHPENRQVAYAIKKVERPCPRCGDTGFCPYCAGRGTKTFVRVERRCERCHGQGICPVCGIL